MTDRCSICLEELHSSIGVAVPCGHCFHRECFRTLKAESSSSSCSDGNGGGGMPRCPICKRRTKRFHDLYLTFQKPDQEEKEEEARRHGCSRSGGSSDDNSDGAVCAGGGGRSLSAENVRLYRQIRDLQSVSRDQSDMLLKMLPLYDRLKAKHALIKSEAKETRRDLRETQEELDNLISLRVELEMEITKTLDDRRHLQEKNFELRKENDELKEERQIMKERLFRSKRKRDRTKTLVGVQATELERAREEMEQLREELHAEKKEMSKLRAEAEGVVRRETIRTEEKARKRKKRRRVSVSPSNER